MTTASNRVEQLATRTSVLVVDDTPANLVALEAVIKLLGYDVVSAGSGAEAIELAQDRQFAVILLDVMMPVLDGFETLERLRALPSARATPVVFLTARNLEASALERAYALGAIDYIQKPFAVPVLLGKLRGLAAVFEQAQEIRAQSAALRAKDRHLAVLAHDVRTPLSVITMSAGQLEQNENPAVRVTASRVARAARRIQGLSDNLLEWARLGVGDIPLKPERLNLSAVCAELVNDLQATYPQCEFKLEQPESLFGSWDRLLLQQALSNLLTNAVKYGTGWVEIRAADRGDTAVVAVENGCGAMTDEQIEDLFAPYAQGKQRHGGVGLGLHIVREMARAQQGAAHGRWSDGRITFTLELKRAAEEPVLPAEVQQ